MIGPIGVRLGRHNLRCVCTTHVKVPEGLETIENADANVYVCNRSIVSSIKSEMGKLRAASIVGMVPLSIIDPGLCSRRFPLSRSLAWT